MTSYSTIVDATARVIADAIDGYIFAAGVTTSVVTAKPLIVPLADDLTEVGFPMVTVTISPWFSILQPGQERDHVDLLCAVWRPRLPLGQNVNLLYDAVPLLKDAFIAHTKLHLVDPAVQSAILMGGSGIEQREVGGRDFLTLPFTVQVTSMRAVVPQPA